MSWIQALLEWLRQFWPFVNIPPWKSGIKITYLPWEIRLQQQSPFFKVFKPETRIEDAESGMHFVIPFLQEIRTENFTAQVMDLLPQTITLLDKTQVSFSVNIEFEVNNVRANILAVHLFKFSMEAASRIHLARRTREMIDWSELIAKQTWLEERLKETLTTRAKRWGVKVIDVGFTDLSSSRTIRLLGDTQAVAQNAIREEYE